MDKRRKTYEKARNIVRNNLDRWNKLTVKVTAQNAHKVIKAYSLFQASRKKIT